MSLPPVGLCESCRNVRVVRSRNASVFYLCELSSVDPAFPRYPRLPVVRCAGYDQKSPLPPFAKGG